MADYHIINAIWQYKANPLSQGRPDSARQHLLELFSVPRQLSDGIFRQMTPQSCLPP
jgi:hypothetical protein